jgi:hypothetical protein
VKTDGQKSDAQLSSFSGLCDEKSNRCRPIEPNLQSIPSAAGKPRRQARNLATPKIAFGSPCAPKVPSLCPSSRQQFCGHLEVTVFQSVIAATGVDGGRDNSGIWRYSSCLRDKVGRESEGWFPPAGSSLGSREELARRKVGLLLPSPGLGLRLFSIRASRALKS